MSIKEELADELRDAMRAKHGPKRDVIRQVETEIAVARSQPGFTGEVDDDHRPARQRGKAIVVVQSVVSAAVAWPMIQRDASSPVAVAVRLTRTTEMAAPVVTAAVSSSFLQTV